jgi:hypothetical protein
VNDLLERVFAGVHEWAGARLDDDATALALAFTSERAATDSAVPRANSAAGGASR